MAKKIDYDKWSKDELIKEITRIKGTTYGLVWHRDLPEEKIDVLINPDARTPSEMFPNEMAGKPFPVLKESKSKAIQTDDAKPVNILIEGDNYHSLAVLNFTHQAAVDLIYIDPPYNTGHEDFKYNDKFVDVEDPFRHSKWLSFIEKRLKLAQRLLKDTGVIFISIDDHEQAPLRMLCDEIFGEQNFISQLVWKGRSGAEDDSKYRRVHEYVLVYARSIKIFTSGLEAKTDEKFPKYDESKDRHYKTQLLRKWGDNSSREDRPNLYYAIKSPEGDFFPTLPNGRPGCWRWEKNKMKGAIASGDIEFSVNGGGKLEAYEKVYAPEADEIRYKKFNTWLDADGTAGRGTKELKELFDDRKVFDRPKPTDLLKKLFKLAGLRMDAVVLDFFAGSGTTAQAILKQNSEDGGNRRFILCTNNENNICTDVCYPRVTKVIKGYKNINKEKVPGLGGNLRYYTTDFVEAGPSDKNKRKLVNESTEMLCIKEAAFDLVKESDDFKIFKNADTHLGIIFHEDAIGDYRKAIKKIDEHFNTYVFSMTDDPHTAAFADIKAKVTLCAIPEVILKVYREVFKHD